MLNVSLTILFVIVCKMYVADKLQPQKRRTGDSSVIRKVSMWC